jgi:hypothetical protein
MAMLSNKGLALRKWTTANTSINPESLDNALLHGNDLAFCLKMDFALPNGKKGQLVLFLNNLEVERMKEWLRDYTRPIHRAWKGEKK